MEQLGAYEGNEVVQQMRLTGHHARHGLVVDMHYVDMEVICRLAGLLERSYVNPDWERHDE